jgi:hypothetical protein
MSCVNNILFGWIEHQDESLRGNTDIYNSAYSIISDCNPEIICGTMLCIRGSDKYYDNKPFAYAYETDEDAEAAYKGFAELVHKINNKEDVVETLDKCPVGVLQ